MRHTIRDLLSIPALAIAAMALSATNVDAQCPGGCFGYPTPSQPAFQSFARPVQYQPVIQVPTQTFVSAPQFAPVQSYAQPQFAPAISAPIQQTFAVAPAVITPMQTFETPQYFPQSQGVVTPMQSFDTFPQSQGIITSGQIAEPTTWNSVGPIVSPNLGTAEDGMSGDIEQGDSEQVEEGRIEGEIISPADDASDSKMAPKEGDGDDMPLTPSKEMLEQEKAEKATQEKAAKEKAAKEKAAKEKAAKEKAAKEKAAKEKAAKEKAAKEKAAKEKAAKEKAAKEKAAKRKAEKAKAAKLKAEKLEAEKAKAAKLEADREKAVEAKASKKKAAQKAKENAKPKVATDAEKIARLENSLRRQINRANQVAKDELSEQLKQLKAKDASDAQIAVAKVNSAVALEEKIKTIRNRVQARIDKLKK